MKKHEQKATNGKEQAERFSAERKIKMSSSAFRHSGTLC